jgi:hypothetical protein
MDRLKFQDGMVEIEQAEDSEGVGFTLAFKVARGSAMDIDLHRRFTAGEMLPLRYKGNEITVSLRSMNDEDAQQRRYEGTAGFLRPGMGGAGG